MGQSASTPFRNNQPQPSNNDSNDTESTTLVQRSVRRIRSIVAGHPYQQQLHQQSLNSQTLTQHQSLSIPLSITPISPIMDDYTMEEEPTINLVNHAQSTQPNIIESTHDIEPTILSHHHVESLSGEEMNHTATLDNLSESYSPTQSTEMTNTNEGTSTLSIDPSHVPLVSDAEPRRQLSQRSMRPPIIVIGIRSDPQPQSEVSVSSPQQPAPLQNMFNSLFGVQQDAPSTTFESIPGQEQIIENADGVSSQPQPQHQQWLLYVVATSNSPFQTTENEYNDIEVTGSSMNESLADPVLSHDTNNRGPTTRSRSTRTITEQTLTEPVVQPQTPINPSHSHLNLSGGTGLAGFSTFDASSGAGAVSALNAMMTAMTNLTNSTLQRSIIDDSTDLPANDRMNYESMVRLADLLGPAIPRNVHSLDIDAQVPLVNFVKQCHDLEKKDDTDKETEVVKSKLIETSDDPQDTLHTKDTQPKEDNVKLVDLIASTSEKCFICLSDYIDGDKLRVMKCMHGFHQSCLDNWLTKYANSCPICRTKAVIPSEANRPPSNTTLPQTDFTSDSHEEGEALFTSQIRQIIQNRVVPHLRARQLQRQRDGLESASEGFVLII